MTNTLYDITDIIDITDLIVVDENISFFNGEENIASIESKIGHKVVGITSENWSLEGYKKTIDDIKSNCLKE